MAQITTALVTTHDKTGLAAFVQRLAARGVTILSTGGTATALRAAGVGVREVAEHTGFPEILDGRVKTLHPAIHAGILARRESRAHRDALAAHAIAPIDLVVANLYPFAATIASGADFETCIENIDIGGPALIRAAAKNHADVTVVVDPHDYEEVAADIEARHGGTSLALRKRLAAKAYAWTAAYDAAIASWFARTGGETFPAHYVVSGVRGRTLRYGENPHQRAALYVTPEHIGRSGVVAAEQVQGKALSHTNILDADAALALVAEFAQPAVVIVKHGIPCGAATAATLAEAYRKALACDPLSAFGGVVATNRALDVATAQAITRLVTDVVVTPGADAGARKALAAKPALRLLVTGAVPDPAAEGHEVRSLAGGLLVQERDSRRVGEADLRTVTRRAPTRREIADLLFAFTVAKHTRSNAVVFARGCATVAIGAGQTSRVDAVRVAAMKASDAAGRDGRESPATAGSVVASDAFFPFADGVEAAAEAGARAVIQPGGSIRDNEVIAAADAADMAMVFTGTRHFKH